MLSQCEQGHNYRSISRYACLLITIIKQLDHAVLCLWDPGYPLLL